MYLGAEFSDFVRWPFVAGLGNWGFYPLMFHLILTMIPQVHLGIYVGMASVVTSLAPALGPTYGGLLTYYASWRMIFLADTAGYPARLVLGRSHDSR